MFDKSSEENFDGSVRQKWIRVIILVIGLGMLFLSPEVLFSTGLSHSVPWHAYYKVFIIFLVFFIDYYAIIDWSLGKNRWSLWFFIANIGVVALGVALMKMGSIFVSRDLLPPDFHDVSGTRAIMLKLSGMMRDAIILILTVSLALAMKLGDRWKTISRRQQEMETANQKAELESLRRQINPHFLFNSLNSIYALTAISPEKAQEAIHLLSRLLRHVLYDNDSMVSLDSEIEFIRNYVDLMKMRLGDSFIINLEVEIESYGEQLVPPLMFVTLVENAFKHGHTGSGNDFVRISFSVEDNMLKFNVLNRYADINEKSVGDGVGLPNLRRRLDLIYGGSAFLKTESDGEIHTVTLSLPMNGVDKLQFVKSNSAV